MNTSTWTPYYKINPLEQRLVRSNMLYTPLVNPEGNVFCMNWDVDHVYQSQHGHREDFTPELIEFFFNKEVENLTVFRKQSWAPEILDIDLTERKIFFKWYGETLNNIVYSDRSLDKECPSWKVQLHWIIADIVNMGYYKLSLYPHCFYLDDKNRLHTFDFYGSVRRSDPFIEMNKIKGMIGPSSAGRFEEAVTDGVVNLEILFKRAMQHYVAWPDDQLQHIYNNIFSS